MYLTLALPTLHHLPPFSLSLSLFLLNLAYPLALPHSLLSSFYSPSPQLLFLPFLAAPTTVCYLLALHYILHIRRDAADKERDMRGQYMVLEVWFDADEEEKMVGFCADWCEGMGRPA